MGVTVAHLRGNDFFDMDNYPEIRFASTSVRKADKITYAVTGDLTIKGVTNPVTVEFEVSGPVKDPWGSERIGLEGSTVINRKDWGVNFNVGSRGRRGAGEREGQPWSSKSRQ